MQVNRKIQFLQFFADNILKLQQIRRMDGLIGNYGGVSDEEEMEFEDVPKTEDQEELESNEHGQSF